MTRPTTLVTGLNFKHFIQSNRICVLKAHVGDTFGFGELAKMQFERDNWGRVNFGHIRIRRVNYRSRVMQDFIRIDMPKIGLRSNSILPGFYLFKDGELRAYHPGTFEPTEVETKIQGVAALAGALAGVIVGFIEKSAAKGFETFCEAMEMPVALKVSEFFKEILGAKNSSYAHQRQHTVLNDEILKAYRLLRVSPSAADAEVTKAWRKLMYEHHPDRHPHDAEAKNMYCVELNNAYQLIKKYRAANN